MAAKAREFLSTVFTYIARAFIGAPCDPQDMQKVQEAESRYISRAAQLLAIIPAIAIIVTAIQLLVFLRAQPNLVALVLEFEGISGLASRSIFNLGAILLPSAMVGLSFVCSRTDIPPNWRSQLRAALLAALPVSLAIVSPLTTIGCAFLYLEGNLRRSRRTRPRTHRAPLGSSAASLKDWALGNQSSPDIELRSLARAALLAEDAGAAELASKINRRQSILGGQPGSGAFREFFSTSVLAMLPLMLMLGPTISAPYSLEMNGEFEKIYLLREDGRNLVFIADTNSIAILEDGAIRGAEPCRADSREWDIMKPMGKMWGANLPACPE